MNLKKKKFNCNTSNKWIWFKIVIISNENVKLNIKRIAKNKKRSLNLLKEKALKADLKVPIRVDQKLIKKNDVMPIISQPKNKLTKLPEETKNTILMIKRFKKTSSLSTKGS